MSMSSQPRVAVVTSHPIQYQAPWFRALARMLDLEVFFCHRQDASGQGAAGFGQAFDWDIPLLDGYAHTWLRNVADRPNVESFAGCDTPSILEELRRGRFDACIVNGWYLKSYVQTVRACRRLGIPVVMRGDSHLGTPRSRVWSAAKYLPYRWLLSQIDAHLYVGRANYRYLRHYGVPPGRLFAALHFVDNDRFAGAARAARESGAVRGLRRAWGAGQETTVFAFAGKLLDKKRPADFVAAVAKLAATGVDAVGVVVGSGPLESELRARVAATRAPIFFAGFQNQSGIASYYAASDVLVLPSDGRETWGLVVNEAMACGTPAVVSDAVGCGEDLVTDDVTGATYPMGDVAALTQTLERMATRTANQAAAMREAAFDRVQEYSCSAAAIGTIAAVDTVCRPREQAAS